MKYYYKHESASSQMLSQREHPLIHLNKITMKIKDKLLNVKFLLLVIHSEVAKAYTFRKIRDFLITECIKHSLNL